MTERLEPDFRLGLTGAIVSYLSWGLMPSTGTCSKEPAPWR